MEIPLLKGQLEAAVGEGSTATEQTQPRTQPQLCELGFSNYPNGWMAFSTVAEETLKPTDGSVHCI